MHLVSSDVWDIIRHTRQAFYEKLFRVTFLWDIIRQLHKVVKMKINRYSGVVLAIVLVLMMGVSLKLCHWSTQPKSQITRESLALSCRQR